MAIDPSSDYAARLQRISAAPWKRLAQPVNPYRWALRRWATGRVLDVGCGIGRGLAYLGSADNVGLDVDPAMVTLTRARGYEAHLIGDAGSVLARESFDALVFSHVLEHMSASEATELVAMHVPYLRFGGRVVAICPQERGHASDPTHVEYMGAATIRTVLVDAGLEVIGVSSFPLPRVFGRWFVYNETIAHATRRAQSSTTT